MKKFLITAIVTALSIMPVFSANVPNKQRVAPKTNAAKTVAPKTALPKTPAAKYEIRKYNFDFENKEEVTLETPVKEIKKIPLEVDVPEMPLPVNTLNSKDNIKDTVKDKGLYTQKEIVKQIRNEEIKEVPAMEQKYHEINLQVPNKVQQPLQKTNESLDKAKIQSQQTIEQNGKAINTIKQNTEDSVKKEINKTNQVKTKAEKKIKYDKDKPPVKFMVVPIQYQGEMKRTIEKL